VRAAAVHGGALQPLVGPAAADAGGQVGHADEGLAERHQVGVAAGQGGLGRLRVVAVVDDPGALTAGGAVGGLHGGVVERSALDLARAAGGAFNHVDVGQSQ